MKQVDVLQSKSQVLAIPKLNHCKSATIIINIKRKSHGQGLVTKKWIGAHKNLTFKSLNWFYTTIN